MSRVGNRPIPIPGRVKVDIQGRSINADGPLGRLELTLPSLLEVEGDQGSLLVKRKAEHKRARSLHGLYARLINNMLVGVSRGFEKKLEMVGVGFRAQMEGNELVMQLGFSHPIRFVPLPGVKIAVASPQSIEVKGCDRQAVGETAARIRRYFPPEPYKGKGIRYQGEYVRKKAGKTVA